MLGWKIFGICLKTGSFTFGGGLAMIPVLQSELCERHKLLDEKEFLDFIAISQSLPGVVAINMSIMVGRKLAGVWGAFMAALAMAIPAFLSILLFLTLLASYRTHPIVQGFLGGVKAAATAIIFLTAVKMWRNVVKRPWMMIVAVAAFIAIVPGDVNVVWVILASGFLGLIIHARHVYNETPAGAQPGTAGAHEEHPDADLDIPVAEHLEELPDMTAEAPVDGVGSHYLYSTQNLKKRKTEQP